MNKTKIDWCDYTWNPVVGCKRGCSYCYARKLHNKRHIAKLEGKALPSCYLKTFNEIQFFPERLSEPSKVKKQSTIFVGSMSDPEYWEKDYFEQILNVCRDNPQHTFMFLSKNPKAYIGFDWPQNTMQGLTISGVDILNEHLIHDFVYLFNRPFFSFEPLLGSIMFCGRAFNYCEKVIVGAMTGKDAIKPKPEWIGSIRRNVPKEKIFWKNNIKKFL